MGNGHYQNGQSGAHINQKEPKEPVYARIKPDLSVIYLGDGYLQNCKEISCIATIPIKDTGVNFVAVKSISLDEIEGLKHAQAARPKAILSGLVKMGKENPQAIDAAFAFANLVFDYHLNGNGLKNRGTKNGKRIIALERMLKIINHD